MFNPDVPGTILALVIVIVMFLLFREVFTWYWKINKLISQNDETIRLLKKLANEPELQKNEKNKASPEIERLQRELDEKLKSKRNN